MICQIWIKYFQYFELEINAAILNLRVHDLKDFMRLDCTNKLKIVLLNCILRALLSSEAIYNDQRGFSHSTVVGAGIF
jgi:hypothetical protein